MVIKRYLSKEIASFFCLILGCGYFLFFLIDYSSHMKHFHQGTLDLSQMLLYYLAQFSLHSEILFPVAWLLTVIKVLTTMNTSLELTALVTSGISYKKILSPFIMASALLTALLYLNYEYALPPAQRAISALDEGFFHSKESAQVHSLPLSDGSLLLYHSYDSEKKAFSDAFWVISQEEVYHIKLLYPFQKTPLGTFVDHLLYEKGFGLKKHLSFETLSLPKMRFEEKALFEAMHPPEAQSLSTLFKSLLAKGTLLMKKMSDRECKEASYFYYRLLLPLLPLLTFLATAPFCLFFHRHFPLFALYAIALFALIAFFALFHALFILSENEILPPLLALTPPVLLAFLMTSYRYMKLS